MAGTPKIYRNRAVLSVSFEEDLINELYEICNEEGVSFSYLLDKILVSELERRKTFEKDEEKSPSSTVQKMGFKTFRTWLLHCEADNFPLENYIEWVAYDNSKILAFLKSYKR